MRSSVIIGFAVLTLGLACDRKPRAPNPDAGAGAGAEEYSLRGQSCRRDLLRGTDVVCKAVVLSVGRKPCEAGLSLPRDGGSWSDAQPAFFGSGCTEPGAVKSGRMGKELVFVESGGEGFIVLCDGARVDHIEEFVQAKLDCMNDPSGAPRSFQGEP